MLHAHRNQSQAAFFFCPRAPHRGSQTQSALRRSQRQENRMTSRSRTAFFGAVAALSLAVPAFAGECPKDKVGVDLTRPTAPEATTAKGLSDVVLSAIDLAKTSGSQFAG